MKKLVTLLLAAGMLLSSVAGAAAVEFIPSGKINVGFFGSNTLWGTKGAWQDQAAWEHNTGNDASYEPVRYKFQLEYELNLDFIASEQLRGRIGFKSQSTPFGQGGFAALDKQVYVDSLYLDWQIPNTPVQVRMGRWAQAGAAFSGTIQMLSPLYAQDGVRLTAKINDNVSLSGLWWRRADNRADGVGLFDQGHADQFHLELPVVLDGILFTPWVDYIRDKHCGEYIAWGPGSMNGVSPHVARFATWKDGNYANSWLDLTKYGRWTDSRVWSFGAAFMLSKFSPFTLAADFAYSNLTVDGVQFNTEGNLGVNAPQAFDRKGWFLSGRASFHTVYGTPSLYAWYTTGDDNTLTNGSERAVFADVMPSGIRSMFGSFFNSTLELAPKDILFNANGTWGVSAQWLGASFVDGLSHSLMLSYIRGTNDPFMARFQGEPGIAPNPAQYMTTKDSAFALDLLNSYKIYKELTLAVDMFYIWQHFDQETWSLYHNGTGAPDNADLAPRFAGTDKIEFSNTWGIGLSFQYAF